MPLIGLLSRHESVIRAAVLHNGNLIHMDGDNLNRQPLYTQIYQGIVRHKEHHHYWVDCSFGPGFLPQEKILPPLTIGQTVTIQISREAFFDTAENAFKAPHLTRKTTPELNIWAQLIPQLTELDELIVDDPEIMAKIRTYCKSALPNLNLKLVYHDLFSDYGLDEIWANLEFPTIDFPGGHGYIETTAAATFIDINGTLAPDIINQNAILPLTQNLKWRNLSGSILIEFVNHGFKQRPLIQNSLKEYLGQDYVVHGFSKLGFIEISRDKRRTPLAHRKVFQS